MGEGSEKLLDSIYTNTSLQWCSTVDDDDEIVSEVCR
jgi:hypothetical protein